MLPHCKADRFLSFPFAEFSSGSYNSELSNSSMKLSHQLYVWWQSKKPHKTLYVMGKNIENKTEGAVWPLRKTLAQPQIDDCVGRFLSSRLKEDVEELGKAQRRDGAAALQREQ